MRQHYREHATTLRFSSDLLFSFEQRFPHADLDILESQRDRHGYDLVAVKHDELRYHVSFVQLKSTGEEDQPLSDLHRRLLLNPEGEFFQISELKSGDWEYRALSDFGRVAVLCLGLLTHHDEKVRRSARGHIRGAIERLRKLIPGLPKYAEPEDIQKAWTSATWADFQKWDEGIAKKKDKLWDDVLKVLVATHKGLAGAKNTRFQLNPRWLRPVPPEDLSAFLFR